MILQKLKSATFALVLIACVSTSMPARAQYFGNNAFQLPLLGWMGFDTTAGFLNPRNQPWPSTDQVQFGFGYMRALVDYKLWLIAQTAVGFGYVKNYQQDQTPNRMTIGLNLSSGLRYNFLEKRIRPFLATQFEYIHLFNLAAFNPSGGWPVSNVFWLGFLLGPGVEWIFARDMGVQVETGAHMLFDFLNPVRFNWSARISYLLYF